MGKIINKEALMAVKSLRARLILAREDHNLSDDDLGVLESTISYLKEEHRRLLGVTADTEYSVVEGQLLDAKYDLEKIRDERKKLANKLVGATSILNAATRVLSLLA
ncbi:hypothetical protein ACMA5I_03030 [Paracoccaceae bacterium GXU_MW_L88]